MNITNRPSPISSIAVSLSVAQILALNNTPFTIVPAQGANKAIMIIGASYECVFGTRPYTFAGQSLNLIYSGLAAPTITTVSESLGILTNGASNWYPIGPAAYPVATSNVFTPLSQVANKAVQINAGGDGYNDGPTVSATINGIGSGYVVNDTGGIDPLSNFSSGDATYKITSVGAGGSVTGFTVTGAGTAYPIMNALATGTGGSQPGVGTGFTVNVTAVQLGDSTLNVYCLYSVVNL